LPEDDIATQSLWRAISQAFANINGMEWIAAVTGAGLKVRLKNGQFFFRHAGENSERAYAIRPYANSWIANF
jgi:hypothetical protein